jgi:hypothetical protein
LLGAGAVSRAFCAPLGRAMLYLSHGLAVAFVRLRFGATLLNWARRGFFRRYYSLSQVRLFSCRGRLIPMNSWSAFGNHLTKAGRLCPFPNISCPK